ncbi:MAG: hypothetical protein KAJ19_00430 [Gammaproteobacteria bacterium]|nr:hypothetical protein [Gammaproteobacteria bacterium]
MLDLDAIIADPMEMKIGDTIYSVKDPGVKPMVQMISLSSKVKKNPELTQELFAHFRSMVPNVPDDIYDRLSAKQLIAMIKYVGESFMTTTDSEGQTKGPLPQGAMDAKS